MIVCVLEESVDYLDVEEFYVCVFVCDVGIFLVIVYRMVKFFEEVGILDKLEFGDGCVCYEDVECDYYDYLIDINFGEVIEFMDFEIE